MTKYKLIDLQGAGMREHITYNSREEVRQDLLDFHSQDLDIENPNDLTLDDLLEIGSWKLIEVNN